MENNADNEKKGIPRRDLRPLLSIMNIDEYVNKFLK